MLRVALAAAFTLAGSPAAADPWERRTLSYGDPAAPLTADAWLPPGPGPHPAVLLVHGGGWTSRTRKDMDGIAKRLVVRGFVVLNASYRLAPAHRYPAAVEDVRSALAFLRSRASELKADPARVAAWGYSAGAHLAGHVAYEDDAAAGLSAVVLGGTPADLTAWPDGRLTTLGKRMSEDPGLFRRASLLHRVTPKAPPTRLYHARGDRLVRPQQALALEAALKAAGVPVELDVVPWSGHVTLFLLRPAAVERAIRFLESRLAPIPARSVAPAD